ncbi:MAG TPA: Na/Pi symporter [Bacillota bacterium]
MGLALLLYGIRRLGAALAELAAAGIQWRLATLGRRPLAAFAAGLVATVVLQSSSATTVALACLAEGRLLSLPAAAAAVVGANVGTTLTAQLLARPPQGVAAWVTALGAFLALLRPAFPGGGPVGRALVGFGLLLWGLEAIDAAAAPLATHPRLPQQLATLEHRPWAGLVAGFVITTVLDSSSASIALLQRLVRAGLLSLEGAVPILFGDNIGTTTATFVIACTLGARARQVAFVHVLFNVVGTLALWPFRTTLAAWATAWSDDPARQLAHAHVTFNALNAALQLPILRLHLTAARRLFPERDP